MIRNWRLRCPFTRGSVCNSRSITASGSDKAAGAVLNQYAEHRCPRFTCIYRYTYRAGLLPALKKVWNKRKKQLFQFLTSFKSNHSAPAADTRRHMSPTLLSAIRNTSEDHRRSIIQAIREIADPNKFQTILIALAAEIEITTILENEDLRQFESEMTD